MSRSLIISAALRHRAHIPFLFGGSLASCPDPLSFQWLSNIAPESLFSFQRLSNITSESPIISAALQHRVRILSFLAALRHHARIPFYFRWLSNIVSESPIFSTALRHHVWILFLFNGSLTSDPNPLLFFTALQHRV